MCVRVERKLLVTDLDNDMLTIEPTVIEEHPEVLAALQFGGQTFWITDADLGQIVDFVDGIASERAASSE